MTGIRRRTVLVASFIAPMAHIPLALGHPFHPQGEPPGRGICMTGPVVDPILPEPAFDPLFQLLGRFAHKPGRYLLTADLQQQFPFSHAFLPLSTEEIPAVPALPRKLWRIFSPDRAPGRCHRSAGSR